VIVAALGCTAMSAQLDPGAWGSDHVGQAVPELIDGEECLFCHRRVIGPSWPRNPHARSPRRTQDDRFLLGNRELRLARPGLLEVRTEAGWDAAKFADQCAGCHASGLDPESKLFWSAGIDCYACHGDATLEHTAPARLPALPRRASGFVRADRFVGLAMKKPRN
jgi:hypothetical protein